ncbi:MAG: hypothetical protein J5884_01700 [Paludibacteraceae bacterium]|nr:hypothetical protein [Paludibacteraceae bacterium]
MEYTSLERKKCKYIWFLGVRGLLLIRLIREFSFPFNFPFILPFSISLSIFNFQFPFILPFGGMFAAKFRFAFVFQLMADG